MVIARLVLDNPKLATAEFGPMNVILEDPHTVVGGCGFLGPPDNEGAVEIGYGIAPSHRGRGIATEALAGLIRHATASAAVRIVWAITQKDDAVSRAVLMRNGFEFVSAAEGFHRYEVHV
jgi:RimJ/RimL family protein N-acetyltransferase